METKHTKGEWEVRGNVIFIKDTYNSIATVHIQKSWDSRLIPIEDAEAKANAKLIATSPKLLKNLIRLIDRMEENDLGHMNAVIEAIKVVEEATGMKYERTPNFK